MSRILLPIIAASRGRMLYLIQEDFDGTGAPSGWSFNGTGTCNYDTAGGISGECLFVASNTNSNQGGAQKGFPGGSRGSFGFYCALKLNFTGTGINRNLWLLDGAFIGFFSTGGPFWLNSGSPITIPRYAWVHVWIDFSGSERSLFISDNATKPASPTATVASGGTCSRVAFSVNHSVGAYIDKIRLAPVPIGSNPT